MADRKAPARWLLAAGALALALLVSEVVLREHYERRLRDSPAVRSRSDLVTEPARRDLLYRLRPGVPGTSNGFGFRDLERTKAPADVYRIAVVGDSVSMQRSIAFEELYWRRLQASLDRKLGKDRVEILNFGVTGYGTRQQVSLLGSEILAFGPDMILWQFHYNDAADPVIDGASGGLGSYYARPKSYLARFVRRRWVGLLQRRAVEAQGLWEIPRDLRLQVIYWDRMTRYFETVRDLAKENRFEVFVFMLPVWPENDDWSRYTKRAFEIDEGLSSRFEELGFPTLSLLPLLTRVHPAPYRSAPDDPWHPNSLGHEWIAEQLGLWLAPYLSRSLPELGELAVSPSC